MTNKVKLFTREEVKSRNPEKETIIIIKNSVYDVTNFFESHPGGEEVFQENAGKDATDAFEDVNHTDDAKPLMEKYKIGELVESDRVVKKSSAVPKNLKPSLPSRTEGQGQSWLTPLLLASIAFIYWYLFV